MAYLLDGKKSFLYGKDIVKTDLDVKMKLRALLIMIGTRWHNEFILDLSVVSPYPKDR